MWKEFRTNIECDNLSPKMQNLLTKNKLNWNSAEGEQHEGRRVERFNKRLLRLKKICPKKFFWRSALEYKECDTTLHWEESILNSHPLTLMLSDANQLNPMCRAQFLQGKCLHINHRKRYVSRLLSIVK